METNDKKLQDELKESAHRIWLAGLGALAAAEQEGSKVFNRLVDRGRDVESRGKVDFKDQVDQAKAKVDEAKAKVGDTVETWSAKLDEAVTSALHRLGVPTRDEIRTLTLRVEELNAKMEHLRPRVTPADSAIVPPVTPEPTDPSKIVV
jgi:poly(hydroxyalkanoate) granule-associated protein